MVKSLEEVTESEDEACGVCLMPPEDDEAYRLEICGHLVCSSCLKMQIISGDLPMQCSQEVNSRYQKLI